MDDKEYGPPPGLTAPRRAPSHATPTALSEPRLTNVKECGPPPGTTAPHRAPSHVTPIKFYEPRFTGDMECGSPPGNIVPRRAPSLFFLSAPHLWQGLEQLAV